MKNDAVQSSTITLSVSYESKHQSLSEHLRILRPLVPQLLRRNIGVIGVTIDLHNKYVLNIYETLELKH